MSARDVIARAAGGKWPFKGYAPGSYICRCSMCNDIFEGDKRACRCPSCALTIAGYRIEECGKFEDYNAVHVNMLRGAIAKPSIDQIAHIYPNIGAVLSAASALVEALALYGFPVSDAAEPALRDGGSREAKALHHAAKDFAATLRALASGESR